MLIIINEMTDMMVVEKIKIGFMITIMIIMIKKKYKGIIQVTEIRIKITMVNEDNRIEEVGKNKNIEGKILIKEKNPLH